MTRLPAFLFTHTASVEAYEGDGARGPAYGDAASIKCLIEEKRRLVKNSLGVQVVSGAALYCPTGTDVPPESRVTINGVAHTAIAVEIFDPGLLALPGSVVVYLT